MTWRRDTIVPAVSHPHTPFRRSATWATLASLLIVSVASASVLYQENFENTAKADRSLRSVNWRIAFANFFDEPVSLPPVETANHYAVINPGPGTGKNPGYVWMSLGPSQIRILTGTVTKWPAPTVEHMRNGRITFDAVGSTAIATVYVLVQLDNKDWYLSLSEFVPPSVGTLHAFESAPGPSGPRHTLPFSTDGGSWQKLLLSNGTPLGFSVPDDDFPASSEITGLGFLVRNSRANQGGVTVRLDTLALEIDEPGS